MRGVGRGMMITHRYYRAFGLRIRSTLRLDEIPEHPVDGWDVTIETGSIDRPGPESPIGRIYQAAGDEQYLAIGSVGKFLILNSREIVVDLAPGFPTELAGYALLGPVMAALLHGRGKLILHGSALAVEGRAVVFVGDKGAGKSTTAGAFVGAGHELITDDVVAIDWDAQGRPMVTPSYPTMKLSSAALELVGVDRFTLLPPPPGNFHKQRVRPRQAVSQGPMPVVAIYALERGMVDDPARLECLDAGGAMRLLFAHSYMARYGRNGIAPGAGMIRHLHQCSRLVAAADMAILHPPGLIARLPDVVDLVRQDIGHAAEPA